MRKNIERRPVAIITAMLMVVATALLSSCSGRTMHNMEPDGETIEVMAEPLPSSTDSII